MTNDFISSSGFGLRHSFVIGHSGFVIFSSHPITLRFPADEMLVVLRIAKSDVVPTGAGPLRHHVRFACGFVGIANPFFRFGQWWLARPGWPKRKNGFAIPTKPHAKPFFRFGQWWLARPGWPKRKN